MVAALSLYLGILSSTTCISASNSQISLKPLEWQKFITVCFCKKLKGFSSKFKIPEGVNAAAGNPSSKSAQANNNRICGRRFTTDNAAATPMTICSKLNYIRCNQF